MINPLKHCFKAEELAAGGDAKYHHLNMPLHVKITSVSPLDQVSALEDVQRVANQSFCSFELIWLIISFNKCFI